MTSSFVNDPARTTIRPAPALNSEVLAVGDVVGRGSIEPPMGTVLVAVTDVEVNGEVPHLVRGPFYWSLRGGDGLGYRWNHIREAGVIVAAQWRVEKLGTVPPPSYEHRTCCECGDPEWGPRFGHDAGCPERAR